MLVIILVDWCVCVTGSGSLLVVPLEVEVTSEPGLYSPQYTLDFGILHSLSTPKTLPILVINSSSRSFEITVRAALDRVSAQQ